MEFLELAKKRYSCRSFLDKEVEKEKIDKMLEVARIAPTAVNFQPQRILVIKDKFKIEKLKDATRYTFDAPIIFAICYDKNVSWKRKYDGNDEGVIDASIVTTHTMLEATDLGLGTTWVGSFNPTKVKEILNIPENYEIISLLPTGYPSKDGTPSGSHEDRNNIEKIAFYEEF